MLKERFNAVVEAVGRACRLHYGERLVSLAVFGSVARGTMRPDSDIDLLLVVDPLPVDRLGRVQEFAAVEAAVEPEMIVARREGGHTFLSPVIKTPAELRQGSFLHFDLTDQARILYDRDGTLRAYLDGLAARLKAMGARRVYKGGGYYRVLKPDYKPGDRIER